MSTNDWPHPEALPGTSPRYVPEAWAVRLRCERWVGEWRKYATKRSVEIGLTQLAGLAGKGWGPLTVEIWTWSFGQWVISERRVYRAVEKNGFTKIEVFKA